MFTAYIIKKRYMLIIDGHDVYEIDEECIKKHRVKGECKVLEKLKEKEQTLCTIYDEHNAARCFY